MKKAYLSIVLAGFSVAALAQEQHSIVSRKARGFSEKIPTSIQPQFSAKATPLWQNDFSNASDWVISNNTGDNQNWEITTTTDPSIGYNTGPWVDASDVVSNENGYALFNSDGVGSDGGMQDAYITNATAFDLSANANVIIQFYQRIRKFTNTETFVQVSSDNGATWTDFEVNAAKPVSVTYEEQIAVNISSAAGGQSSVLIRFNYRGSWDYLWAVDDVKIFAQPDNNIEITTAYFSGENNEGTEYGRTPMMQLDDAYLVGLDITNTGVLTQTAITATADFGSFTSNFSAASIAPQDTINLENTETPTLAVGQYDGVFTATSAEETSGDYFDDNTYNRSFAVTNDVYSIDGIDIYPAADLKLSSLGTNSFTGGEDNFLMASWYHVKQAQDFYGVRIELANGTVEGAEVSASIIDTTELLADGTQPLVISDIYNVTAADITNGYMVIPFTSSMTLSPGCYYAAVTLSSFGNTSDIRILDDQTVSQPPLASVIYIPGDGTYTNGEATAIRLLAGTTGLDETTMEGVSVYPNPSNGLVNISNDNHFSNTITVTDITGKVVTTTSATAAAAIDLSAYGKGVYMVTISNEKGRKTERVVIK